MRRLFFRAWNKRGSSTIACHWSGRERLLKLFLASGTEDLIPWSSNGLAMGSGAEIVYGQE